MIPFHAGPPPHSHAGGPGQGPMMVPGVDFPSTRAEPRHRDLAYASTSASQTLDLYLPDSRGPFPLVMLIHGGAFLFGDKADPPSTAGTDELLEHGFAVANVNYRLSGEARAPALVRDVKTAVRWLRAHAAEYRLQPDRIAAWGASAGANLAALLGTSAGEAFLEGAELGWADQPSAVQAVVDWFGPTDFLQMDRQLSESSYPVSHDAPDSPESLLIGAPIQSRPDLVQVMNPVRYVNARVAPFLIEHGTCDRTVPVQQSQLLAQAIRAAAGPERVRFLPLEGAVHGGGPQFWSQENLALVLSFLDEHLR